MRSTTFSSWGSGVAITSSSPAALRSMTSRTFVR